MSIVRISETKWFGEAVYKIEGHTILHSERPLPRISKPVEQNKDVGTVLDGCMTKV